MVETIQVNGGAPHAPTPRAEQVPYAVCLCIGLGGLFAGVTGPLLSTFIPPLVRDALGEDRTAIALVMAIDNGLLLLLVPWSGAASERSSAAGRGRRPIVIGGLALSALGMALFPWSARFALLALTSAAWTFPTVNSYPMFVEPVPRERRGVLSALFLLCRAIGGGVGDPMNGALFDLFGSYRRRCS